MTDTVRSHDEAHEPGTPPGMNAQDVDARFEVGRWFGKEIWPADKAALLHQATTLGAPEEVLGRLQGLPEGNYTNTQEVVTALGIGVEDHRP